MVSWLRTCALLALAVTFVVAVVDPTAPAGHAPDWTIATGHPHGVKAVAFSHDGRMLATGGEDGEIVIWEVGKGVEKELLSERHRNNVVRLAFAPDGTTLASRHSDGWVVLWDPINSREHTTLSGNLDEVGDLDFSPDGATLATANHDRSIQLWDVASGRIKATLVSHPDAFCALRFSPDGRTLASGSSAGVVRLWDVSSGKCRLALGRDAQSGWVQSLAFSPDGSKLVSVGLSHRPQFWDVASGLEESGHWSEASYSRQVEFCRGEQSAISVKYDGTIQLIDSPSGSESSIHLGDIPTICSAMSPDRSLLAFGDLDGTVRVWDLEDLTARRLETALSDR